jgi:hypothetical protein
MAPADESAVCRGRPLCLPFNGRTLAPTTRASGPAEPHRLKSLTSRIIWVDSTPNERFLSRRLRRARPRPGERLPGGRQSAQNWPNYTVLMNEVSRRRSGIRASREAVKTARASYVFDITFAQNLDRQGEALGPPEDKSDARWGHLALRRWTKATGRIFCPWKGRHTGLPLPPTNAMSTYLVELVHQQPDCDE